MKKVIHIISGLGGGGAENMLHKLLKYSDRDLYYHEVISLVDEGIMGEKIKAEGIKIHSLHLNNKNIIQSLLKAKKISEEFDVVNTWLYHGDIFGFILSKLLLKKKLIWNVRHSNLDKDANKRSILRIAKINSKLSKYVDCITYNSVKAYENHVYLGYNDKNSKIVPNGFELDKFSFNNESRKKIREELKLRKEQKVLITVGRWNIQKDYLTLVRSLNELNSKHIQFKMLMVGTNLDHSNKELEKLISEYKLDENVILLGRRSDIPDLLSASDIFISSSLGESFSNAIGEAMACGLPCVVTDVGDSRDIVGNAGLVVEKQDYANLGKALHELLSSDDIDRFKKEARSIS